MTESATTYLIECVDNNFAYCKVIRRYSYGQEWDMSDDDEPPFPWALALLALDIPDVRPGVKFVMRMVPDLTCKFGVDMKLEAIKED